LLSGLPFYVWEVPGKPISIQLHFDVIDRVSPDILRGLGALKRRGAEVGGILLGSIQDGPHPKVIVEDFVSVQSEYLTGPSYNLSPNDLVGFEAVLERCKSDPTGKLSVVGFYRSHTRDELYMDDADLALANRYFSEPGNVFMLIKPFATRPCIGGFFFWEDGQIYRESTYLQFPFDRRELGGGETRLAPPTRNPQAEGSGSPLPPYTPAAEREPELLVAAEQSWQQPPQATRTSSLSILAATEEQARPSNKLQWRWLLVPGFLAIAGVSGFVAYRNLDSAKASGGLISGDPALPLKLSVSERKSQLDVTWDRNAQSVTRARRGVLSISDGSKRRDLELSGPQLRNGRVLYSRLSGDVNLRLEVFPDGQPSVVESIRIISTEAPPAEPLRPVAVQRPAAAPKPKSRSVPSPPRIASHPAPSRGVLDAAPKTPVVPPAQPPEEELSRPERRR
jgi:hypothetical protein